MRRLSSFVFAVALLAVAATAQELTPDDQALKARIESRFDVVPLSDGIALRPKTRVRDVRLIEVSDTVSINGVVVSGRELQDRLGTDAESVLKLSYLQPAARRALFATERGERTDDRAAEPQDAAPPAPRAPEPDRERPMHDSGGDRIRIFGDVAVREGESIRGQVVAVIGSVRIDGEVGDQVVAVLGSVDLGEHAVVHGDIVSVGGRVHRAPGAQVRGAVTEVSLAEGDWRVRVAPWLGGLGVVSMFDGLGAVPRLIGTGFRLVLLLLFASIAMIVARGTVEGSAQRISDNPVKATLVGLAAELLFVPMLVLTCVLLVLTIIGIPLLLLVPFVVVFLLFLGFVGFTGAALTVGQWARRRFNIGTTSAFADVWVGVVILLLPVIVGRLVALGGFLTGPVAILLIAAGTGLEFLAWSTGFGAVLANTFSRWKARRVT